MAEVSSPTREICNSLSLSTQKWVMTDCPPRQEKVASEWLCNEPRFLWSSEESQRRWRLCISMDNHARRRSGWRVARGVDQKCQKTENNVCRWQCIIKGFTAMYYAVQSWNELLSANTNKLKSSNSLCHRAKPKHLEVDSATGSWTPRVITEDQLGD